MRPLLVSLALVALAAELVRGQEASVSVDASEVIGRWDAGVVANLGYDPLYLLTTSERGLAAYRHVERTRVLHFVRCHNYFSDGLAQWGGGYFGCRIYSEDADGRPEYAWWHLDHVLDTILSAGTRPIVECDFMPDALAAGDPLVRNYGGGLINLPKDFGKYRDLCAALVRHCEERYGAYEVRQWRFEVWNEPDLGRYWIGGRGYGKPAATDQDLADFCKLYDYFAAGVAAADRQVKLGGPGMAGDVGFLRRFLQHCVSGTNHVTGETGSRIDFISWHCYAPRDGIIAKCRQIGQLIEQEFPQLADRERQLNEWGQPIRVQGRPNPTETVYTNVEAALMCSLARRMLDDPQARVGVMLRWGQIANDHFGDGWRPLMTMIGDRIAPLALYNAYDLMARLGRERVGCEAEGDVEAIACRSKLISPAQVLLFRYDQGDENGEGPAVDVTVEATGLSARDVGAGAADEAYDGELALTHYRIDRDHSNAFGVWDALGRPRPADERQAEQIHQASRLAKLPEPASVRAVGGKATVTVTMPPNSVSLIIFGREAGRMAEGPSEHVQRVTAAAYRFEQAQGLERQGRPSEAGEMYERIAQDYADLFWMQEALRRLIALAEADNRAADADDMRARLLGTLLDDTERESLLAARIEHARGTGGDVADLQRELASVRAKLAPYRQWRNWR